MGGAPTFVTKRDARTFMMEDGMGDVFVFVIKGDTPLEKRVSFTCIIEDHNRNVRLSFVIEADVSRI
jgi:hypothetical protein